MKTIYYRDAKGMLVAGKTVSVTKVLYVLAACVIWAVGIGLMGLV